MQPFSALSLSFTNSRVDCLLKNRLLTGGCQGLNMSEEVSKVRLGLKALRKKAGLTQIELAMQVQVREKAVRAWENGGAVPSFDTAFLLAKALGVSLEQLAHEFGLDKEVNHVAD